MTIYFYSTRDKPYGCFSNFSPHGFSLNGVYWPTVEQYFQAQKFVGKPDEAIIRLSPTAKVAAQRGRQRSRPLRPDWETVKDAIMREGVRRKFSAHDTIRAILLSTGREEIVEASPIDWYWGVGSDGTGKNMLGRILMEIRDEFAASESLPQ